jgi:branched-subunit amino acid ABC-type transport system permease component
MHRLLRIALLAGPVLAGCGAPLDTEQLRLCRRVLPALHPDATDIRETRATSATLARQGVRIEYSAREPGGEAPLRHIVCGFGGATFDRERRDLAALQTDEGPIGEARLLYLNRFWLADAATEAPADPLKLPQIPASAAYALQQLVNAIALSSVYALLATAYSLIYGLVGRINLAFGQIAVVGAFGAIGGVGAAVALGLDNPLASFALALVIAAALSSLWSWFVGAIVVAPLHARYRLGQPVLVATAAVAITIEESLRLFQGVRERWMPPVFNDPIALAGAGPFIVTVTTMQICIASAALAAAAGVLLVLARSAFGRQWRAFADDPQAAALFGVSPNRLLTGTFVLAGLLAGLAGWIVAVYYGNVGFAMGTMLGLKALVAAVLGGIGSVPGAFLGGLVVGLIEAGWSAYFDIGLRDLVVYAILIVVFVLRPGGLLGFASPSPRQV